MHRLSFAVATALSPVQAPVPLPAHHAESTVRFRARSVAWSLLPIPERPTPPLRGEEGPPPCGGGRELFVLARGTAERSS